MDGNDLHDVEELLVKLAVIARQLDSRSADAVARIERSADALELSAQHVSTGSQAFSRQALQAIQQGTHASVAEASRRAFTPIEAQLERSVESAAWAADALAEQRKLLTRAQRGQLRAGCVALIAGSLLAAAAAGLLGWRAVHVAGVQDAVAHAADTGLLVRCPDRPSVCVRLDRRAPRAGRHGEYVVIAP